jgi:hypothetical protein
MSARTVYAGLHAVIGKGNIGKFLEDLARPFVLTDRAADKYREAEAEEWCEALADGGSDAAW